eukprot:Opistho-2@46777
MACCNEKKGERITRKEPGDALSGIAPRGLRSYITWWSVLVILVILAANVVLPIVVYNAVSDSENTKLTTAFNNEARSANTVVMTQIVRTIRAIANLRIAVFLQRDELTAEGFNSSVALLTRLEAVAAVAWIPRVSNAQKDAFENATRAINANSTIHGPSASGYATFAITELRNNSGNVSVVPVTSRPIYYPLTYLWPPLSARTLLGFDVASLPSFFGNVSSAISTGQPALFSDVSIITSGREKGILVYMPVYTTVNSPPPELRDQESLGVLASAASIQQLILTSGLNEEDIHIYLFDDHDVKLYATDSVASSGSSSIPAVYGLRYQNELPAADRNWTFVAVPTAALSNLYTSSNPALFTALTALGIFFLLVVALFGIRQLVQAKYRTALSENRRKRVNAMIGYVNHELRNPLQGVIGLVEHATMTTKNVLRATSPSKERIKTVLGDLQDTSQMCELMCHLVDDALDIRKLEEGRLVIRLEVVYLDRIISDVAAIVQSKLTEKQRLTLEVRLFESDVALLCDPMRVKQLLLNLISNSIKYSDVGPIILSVEQKTADGKPWLRFSVKDSGQGIPADKQSLVFSPFSQMSNAGGRHQGAGLGLYLCAMLVDALGGKIGFESTYGAGSTFWFEIPFIRKLQSEVGIESEISDDTPDVSTNDLHSLTPEALRLNAVIVDQPTMQSPCDIELTTMTGREEVDGPARAPLTTTVMTAADTPTTQSTNIPVPRDDSLPEMHTDTLPPVIDGVVGQISSSHDNARALKVALRGTHHLVCDDGRINRLVLRRYIEEICPEAVVDEAENGQQAIEVCADRDYCVIWMDIRMPFLDGIEATKRIRTCARHAHTPIIGVTGDVTAEEVSFYGQIGMNRVVSKPVTRKRMVQLLTDLIHEPQH